MHVVVVYIYSGQKVVYEIAFLIDIRNQIR